MYTEGTRKEWVNHEKSRFTILWGGLLGLGTGAILGAYIGLILGGTFLRGFDIHEAIGIEGYELTTYLGGLLGAVGGAMLGIRLMSRRASSDSNITP